MSFTIPTMSARPVESHRGAQETLIVGRRGGNMGRGVTLLTIPLGVWGSVIRSPSRVQGGAPARNGFYAYSRSVRSHLEHPFQYF